MYGFYVAFVYETHTMGCIMNCANRFLDHFNVFITDIITDFIEQELLYTYFIFINQTVSSCWWFGKPWCSCDVTVMFSMNPSESWISLKYKFLSYFKNAWRRFRDNPLSRSIMVSCKCTYNTLLWIVNSSSVCAVHIHVRYTGPMAMTHWRYPTVVTAVPPNGLVLDGTWPSAGTALTT